MKVLNKRCYKIVDIRGIFMSAFSLLYKYSITFILMFTCKNNSPLAFILSQKTEKGHGCKRALPVNATHHHSWSWFHDIILDSKDNKYVMCCCSKFISKYFYFFIFLHSLHIHPLFLVFTFLTCTEKRTHATIFIQSHLYVRLGPLYVYSYILSCKHTHCRKQ